MCAKVYFDPIHDLNLRVGRKELYDLLEMIKIV